MRAPVRNFICVCLLCAVVLCIAAAAQVADQESAGVYSNRYRQHADAAQPAQESYVDGAWNTHLPLVCLDTNGVTVPGTTILDERGSTVGYELAADGSTTIPFQIAVFDREGVYHQPNATPDLEASGRIRVRGNTSRMFDKKSYKMNFYSADGREQELNIMGMGQHDEWALYGPFLDKTLLRNYLFLNMSGELEPYTSDVRFCEVMLNSEYQGVYIMTETIAQGTHRVNISASSTRRDMTSYILRVDREWDSPEELDNFTYYTTNLEPGTRLSVIYPGTTTLTPQFHSYITADFSAFEKALYSYDFNDPQKGYRAYIDVQSFADYYLLSEFLLINDMTNRSTYLYKDLGDKIHMGPCWDFNNAGDNFLRPVAGGDGVGFNYSERPWYRMLLKDEYFVEQVIETYREMRNGGILDETRLLNEIDAIVAYLGEAIDRNYEIWGYSFDASQLDNHNRLRPLERNPMSYEEAVSDLKNFLIRRGRWMDENIETLRQNCHVSMIKQYLD